MANKRRQKEGNPNQLVKLAKTTSFGVCTRAKSMALEASVPSHASPTIVEQTRIDNVGEGCYLHLRSRRLERFQPFFVTKARKNNKCALKKKGFDLDEKENVGVVKFEEKHKNKEKIAFGENEGENRMVEKQEKGFKRDEMNKNEEKVDYDDYIDKVEDSFGENDLDFENKQRITRENTPSSFAMSKDKITTRMSSNKETIMKQMKIATPIKPSLQELELFFADAEKCCIEKFIKKYNFDLVKEKPYEGRFEWVQIKP